MAILQYFNVRSLHPKQSDASDAHTRAYSEDEKKEPTDVSNSAVIGDGESIASSAPEGVRMAQATTIVWTRKALLIVYAL